MTVLMDDGRQPVIFCDFDGTITDKDVIMMIMEAFAPPVWRDIVDRILNRRTLSIKDGVTQLFHLIPGTKRAEIETFVLAHVQLRHGFKAFLAFCREHHIPFNVVSGGADFFIQPILAPFTDHLALYCNTGCFPDDRIDLTFPYPGDSCEACGQCACCKISIMDRYPTDTHFRMVIGDSLTDLAAARCADWVFARSKLVQYAEEEGIPFTPFESFDEIQTALTARLKREEVSYG